MTKIIRLGRASLETKSATTSPILTQDNAFVVQKSSRPDLIGHACYNGQIELDLICE